MKKLFTLYFAVLCSLTLIDAQQVRLVKDITPGPGSGFDSDFIQDRDGIKYSFDDKILFLMENDDDNLDLWISDGSEAGTSIIVDGRTQYGFYNFVENDSHVYFALEDFSEGSLYSLSKSDLTVDTIVNSDDRLGWLTWLGDDLFYSTDDQLFKLDVSTGISTTDLAFDWFYGIKDVIAFNDDQLLIMGDYNDAMRLLLTDGTEAGTTPIYNLNAGSDFSRDYHMTKVDDKVFFFYSPDGGRHDLWVTDGTTAGTLTLGEFQHIPFSTIKRTESFIGFNGEFYFKARELGQGQNFDVLYVSDGTVAGTRQLNMEYEYPRPAYFTIYNDELYFRADRFNFVFDLYKTDGTDAGTVRPIDGSAFGSGSTIGGSYLEAHGDSLYFNGYKSEIGGELFSSQGNTADTRFIDAIPGDEGGSPRQVTSTSNHLFFLYTSEDYGRELHVLDYSSGVGIFNPVLPTLNYSATPNPFDESLVLSDNTIGGNYRLTDLTGKVIFAGIITDQTLDLTSLESGMYMLTVVKDGYAGTQKVVKR